MLDTEHRIKNALEFIEKAKQYMPDDTMSVRDIASSSSSALDALVDAVDELEQAIENCKA